MQRKNVIPLSMGLTNKAVYKVDDCEKSFFDTSNIQLISKRVIVLTSTVKFSIIKLFLGMIVTPLGYRFDAQGRNYPDIG